jgi:hypothetical protein
LRWKTIIEQALLYVGEKIRRFRADFNNKMIIKSENNHLA